MSKEIIGYRRTGKDTWMPIVDRPGMVVTAAIMSCSDCGTTISPMGGPGHNCLCPECFTKFKLVNFTEGNNPL